MDNDAGRWAEIEEAVELIEQGLFDQAESVLLSLAEAKSQNEYVYFFLGNLLFEKADYERALKAYVQAVEIKPDYAGALVASGHTLRMMGKLDSAIRVGKQLILQNPDDQDGLFLLGLSHYARGDEQEASEFLKRFVDSKPELEASLEARAIIERIENTE